MQKTVIEDENGIFPVNNISLNVISVDTISLDCISVSTTSLNCISVINIFAAISRSCF